jgi:hypothetical protein
MGLDITGIGEGLAALKGMADKIWPDKTEVEKAQLTAVLSQIQAQTDIDKAEAQSSDPLQHWRGGLGWVCVVGYFHNFIFQPLFTDACALLGKSDIVLHPLDIGPLATLTLGMLGLGGLHVAERVKGAT